MTLPPTKAKCLVLKYIFNSGYSAQHCQISAPKCKFRDEANERVEKWKLEGREINS